MTPQPQDDPAPRRRWYADGLRFECSQGGKCCTAHGEYERVYLDDDETHAAAQLLGMSVETFEQEYCAAPEGYRELVFRNSACPFLVEHRCAIYAARPAQCKTWPFWRENLRKRTWEREVATFCPGVGKGKLYSEEEINRLADES